MGDYGGIGLCSVKLKLIFMEPREKDVPYWSTGRWEEVDSVICDGTIRVGISLYEEPHWGGTSPNIRITYTCDKCGNTDFPELPQFTWELATLVEEYVQNWPEEQRKRWRKPGGEG